MEDLLKQRGMQLQLRLDGLTLVTGWHGHGRDKEVVDSARGLRSGGRVYGFKGGSVEM